MGMSTDMAPTYISMNPSGQMTYILDSSNINLAQVQLAVPGSEIVLIQDDSKAINLCENPDIITDTSSENVTWLGNNVIVLVSQPQEFIVVEQEVVVDSNVVQTTPAGAASNASLSQIISKENSETFNEIADAETTTTVEDAKCWFKDSLITTAALSKLTSFIQSNGNTKIG